MSVRLLWAVTLGFLIGVFIASVFHVHVSTAAFIAFLGATALMLGTSLERRGAFVLAVALIALACGLWRMDASGRIGDPTLSARIGQTVTLRGIVTEEPDAREGSVRLTVDVSTLSTTTPVRARVLIVAPAHDESRYGDRIEVTGKLELPRAFDAGAGRAFDYPKFLAKDGILYTLSFAKVTPLGEHHGNPIKAAAIAIKRTFIRGMDNALPEPEAGLASGITVGDKRSIGKELSDDFQKVSLVHMLVLSGYNITVVINAATALLATFSQSIRFGAAGLIVVFFALMAGGAASAVRAGAMALIAIFARVTHRIFLAERALAVVCAGMVAWNPWTLVYDPGFQLSVLATLGLILFTPLFAHWFVRVPEKFGVREILSSTCATQLMVLPLLLYENGTLSIFALPANLLALPTVPYAMFLSLVSGILGLVSGPLAIFFGAPAYVLLWYEIHVATFFASLPLATLSIPSFSAWWLALVYAVLLIVYVKTKTVAPPDATV